MCSSGMAPDSIPRAASQRPVRGERRGVRICDLIFVLTIFWFVNIRVIVLVME